MGKSLEFISDMDKKLHRVVNSTFRPNMSPGVVIPIKFDDYTENKLSKEEIEKVLKIAKKPNYLLQPINTAMGFSIGYDVLRRSSLGKIKSVLRFTEGQLPEGYDFEKLSETFMRKDNLLKAKLSGLEIINNKNHYEY